MVNLSICLVGSFSIPNNSWSRRVNIKCNVVLTPRHSPTKGWMMICLGIKGSGTMILMSFWHPSYFFLASKLVGQSLQSTAVPFGKLDKFSFLSSLMIFTKTIIMTLVTVKVWKFVLCCEMILDHFICAWGCESLKIAYFHNFFL